MLRLDVSCPIHNFHDFRDTQLFFFPSRSSFPFRPTLQNVSIFPIPWTLVDGQCEPITPDKQLPLFVLLPSLAFPHPIPLTILCTNETNARWGKTVFPLSLFPSPPRKKSTRTKTNPVSLWGTSRGCDLRRGAVSHRLRSTLLDQRQWSLLDRRTAATGPTKRDGDGVAVVTHVYITARPARTSRMWVPACLGCPRSHRSARRRPEPLG